MYFSLLSSMALRCVCSERILIPGRDNEIRGRLELEAHVKDPVAVFGWALAARKERGGAQPAELNLGREHIVQKWWA